MPQPQRFLGAVTLSSRSTLAAALLLGGNLVCNILAHIGFKLSATSDGWRGFLLWQAAGNLAGFLAVLALTGLLRFLPLHVAYPLSAGLAVIGIQMGAARLFFGEVISPGQWLGTALVIVGIALIGGK
jgi:multidrug transporter EmrE-like cation transporter